MKIKHYLPSISSKIQDSQSIMSYLNIKIIYIQTWKLLMMKYHSDSNKDYQKVDKYFIK